MTKLFGDKAFYKRVIIIAMPIVIQQLITSSVQLVDNLMVGSLGELAIGAVSVVNQLYFVVIIVTFGAMGGAGIFSAQFFGSKQHDKLKQTFRFKLLIALVLSTSAILIFSLFGEYFISLFTDNPTTISWGMDYLNIAKWVMIPLTISSAISSTFREIGITKPLLKISSVAILLNVVLNYLLIFGNFGFPKLGIEGAAIATLVSRTLEFILLYVLLVFKGKVFNTSLLKIFRIDGLLFKVIIITAIPLVINEFLFSFGQTFFMQSYATRGDNALAAINITNAISQLVFITFGGIGTAVAVFVGNTMGENKLKEAKANSMKIIVFAVMFAFVLGIVLFILSFFVLNLYDISSETEFIAKFNIRVNAFMIPVISLYMVLYFTLRSGGDTRSTMIMDSGYIWVVQVPVIFVLSRFTNLPVIFLYLIIQSLELPKVILAYSRYKKEYWLRNLAVENDENAERLMIKQSVEHLDN
ncbi:MAG: MATE family efflux transporter [Tenericutes bacterium]|jgi:putative MATE family efflux protein|nr:MATE family efflux transporter [Mycoplasmatota bacterium]